jgi:energy-coupling factor transporter ATP-binding protein EcfA2
VSRYALQARYVADVFVDCPPDAPLAPATLRGARRIAETAPSEVVAKLAVDAERLDLLVPAGGDPSVIGALHEAAWKGTDLTVVLDDDLVDGIDRTAPGAGRVLAMASATTLTGETPPFWLAVIDGTVVAFGPGSRAVARIDTDAAREWATELVADARTDAEPAPVEMPVGDAAFALEYEGFQRLSASYFAERIPDPATCWRVSLGLPEVNAGYAIERPPPAGSDADSLAAHVSEKLRENRAVAVVGAAGSGKSTVCKQVACSWHESGDPVLYREGNAGATFDSPEALRAVCSRLDGTPLVVVEDATRPGAVAVFELLDTPGIAVLMDARTAEWDDVTDRLVSAEAAAARDRVKTVQMPPVTTETVRRLREAVAETTDRAIDLPVERLLPDDPGPGDMLSVLHRLALATEPLADDPPTSLREDVRRAHRRLEERGEAVLKAGVLVNLLNASGGDVPVTSLSAIAGSDAESVVSALDGVVLFDGEPPHDRWSEQFLAELLTLEGAAATHRLVAETVSSLLALADGPEPRRHLESETGGSVDAQAVANAELDRIAADPTEWVLATTRQVLALGEETPALAPAPGPPGGEAIEWPVAAP